MHKFVIVQLICTLEVLQDADVSSPLSVKSSRWKRIIGRMSMIIEDGMYLEIVSDALYEIIKNTYNTCRHSDHSLGKLQLKWFLRDG